MPMLSEDDLNLKGMTREELDKAWDLWFDLAQTTNESDPPYTHGVFVPIEGGERAAAPAEAEPAAGRQGLNPATTAPR